MTACVAAAIAGQVVFAAPVGTTSVIDRSIVHVGDAVIWQSDLELRARGVVDPKARTAILEEMIDEELVIAEARRGGITIDQADVLSALDEVKKQNNLDDASFDSALRGMGYSRARYLVALEQQLLRLRAIYQFVGAGIEVTDADVDAEAKVRKLAVPVQEPEKSNITRDLRRRATDAATVAWIATLRKRAWIERRP
jgi:parvulin-like peptidyl-prolyl isomerase